MKGNRDRKLIICEILLVVLAVLGGTRAMAESGESIRYAVRAVLPDNQFNDEVSYFDLMMEPGQEQVLEVVVKNKGSEDIEVAMEANVAYSNVNGVIEFTESEERDPSLMVDFSKIVTVPEPVISIPAGQQAIAEFVVKMPEESYDGIVYGGLMFTKLNQGQFNEESTATILNIYRYVIGVRLRESEKEIEPEFELLGAGLPETKYSAIRIDLRNPQPLIARRIAMQVDVYQEQGADPVLSAARNGLEMAPNSWMPYTLYLQDQQQLSSGTYLMKVQLQHEGRSWQFETPLVIE